MTFKDEKDQSEKTVRVPLGTSLLEAAHENDIDLEGESYTASRPARACVGQIKQLWLD